MKGLGWGEGTRVGGEDSGGVRGLRWGMGDTVEKAMKLVEMSLLSPERKDPLPAEPPREDE